MASPRSLYKLVIQKIAGDNNGLLGIVPRQLTVEMQFDICLELFVNASCSKNAFELLKENLGNLEVFLDFLQIGHKRMELHKMFELCNEDNNNDQHKLWQSLSDAFIFQMRHRHISNCLSAGQNLASFLMDAGWYVAASNILNSLKEALSSSSLPTRFKDEINAKLLHAYSEYRQFDKADQILVKIIPTDISRKFCSSELCEVSNYYYWRSLYQDSHSWSMKALRSTSAKTPSRVVIDVLRQSGKANVVRRQFSLAQLLLTEALFHAKDVFGKNHLKYADCLLDYAFYLLNVDEVGKSVLAYEEALLIRESILGRNNLLVAKAYEELAYATYVHEYSSGQFEKAKMHAEAALLIMQKLIPSNHLLVASSQRVLALILEEIAIDMTDKKLSQSMLAHSEELHLSAVSLSTQAFGEMNVQTAKHYGNLGRLYQTMTRYDMAEKMHLKAIHIKEALLGRDDYEVALSIGHLASLYNYDLDEFDKAEELYLRSISIALRLFGPSYSGLEYDYRGLIRVYEETDDWNNVYKYIYMLRDWKELKRAKESKNIEEMHGHSRTLDQIIQIVDQTERKEHKASVRLKLGEKSSLSIESDPDSMNSSQRTIT